MPALLAPIQARLVLLAAAVLLALAASALDAPAPPPARSDPVHHVEDRADLILYARIVERLRAGDTYYAAAADSLRAGNYPLKPFVTFRLPSLAMLQAALPPWASPVCLYLLAAFAFFAWLSRLRLMFQPGAPLVIAAVLIACGFAMLIKPGLVAFHEPWAGLMIALSLALRTEDRWLASVGAGLCAMLLRETAALYVLVMMGTAMIDRRPREAIAWGMAMLSFAGAVALHAHQVAAVVTAEDPASPGWTGMLGVGFLLNVMRDTSSLSLLPHASGSVLAALALFGWVAAPGPLARRVGLTIAAYGLLLALFCRIDTYYWALMLAPVFLLGLAWVPDGLRDAAITAFRRPVVA
jgi:hypothetical protein